MILCRLRDAKFETGEIFFRLNCGHRRGERMTARDKENKT